MAAFADIELMTLGTITWEDVPMWRWRIRLVKEPAVRLGLPAIPTTKPRRIPRALAAGRISSEASRGYGYNAIAGNAASARRETYILPPINERFEARYVLPPIHEDRFEDTFELPIGGSCQDYNGL